jgi:hypothetical protein
LFALVRVAKDQVLTVYANEALSGQPKALMVGMKYAVVISVADPHPHPHGSA